MPTVLNVVPTNHPTSLTAPSDGDGPGIKAADVVPALQGLLDRGGWVEARLQESIDFGVSALLNFPVAQSTPGMTMAGSGAVWNDLAKAWFTFGNSGGVSIKRSSDAGVTWGSNEQVDASRNIVDAAVQPSTGNMVLVCSTAHVYTYSLSSNTYTLTAVAGFVNTANSTRVQYSVGGGSWLAIGYDGVLGNYVLTSTNGTAWTARTPPAAFTAATFAVNTVRFAIDGAQNVVSVTIDTNTRVRTMTSADSGQTWTDRGNTNLATVTNASVLNVVWDPAAARFLMSVAGNGGVGATKTDLYYSTNGTTWTLLKSFATSAVFGLVPCGLSPLGPRLVAMIGSTALTEIAYSVNAGATWRFANVNLASTAPLSIVAGVSGSSGSQLMALTTTKVLAGLRGGLMGQVIT
jgi:hypothetical protein